MSFPPGTEMFQFPGFASYPYVFRIGSPCGGVAPFGYLWIKTCSRFPKAFRSVPRPSSPPGAKASTECPFVVQYFAPEGAAHIIIKLERDLMTYPPCTGTIHRNHVAIIATIFKSTARNGRSQNNPDENSKKLYPVPARNSCNSLGHHNQTYCIIIHLNTRTSQQL
jgi:hypothetical protein